MSVDSESKLPVFANTQLGEAENNSRRRDFLNRRGFGAVARRNDNSL